MKKYVKIKILVELFCQLKKKKQKKNVKSDKRPCTIYGDL